jgi:hypothetical protein
MEFPRIVLRIRAILPKRRVTIAITDDSSAGRNLMFYALEIMHDAARAVRGEVATTSPRRVRHRRPSPLRRVR